MSTPSQSQEDSGSEIEFLRRTIGKYFSIYEIRVSQAEAIFFVRAPVESVDKAFDELRRELLPKNYIPTLTLERGEHVLHIVKKPPLKESKIIWNILLLLATLLTTTFAGMLLWAGYVGITELSKVLTLSTAFYGIIFFALPLMLILGTHELGHYFAAKRHGVSATLPYFIPVPPPFLFGTMGAFISIKEPIPDRKALMDIGFAGPISGFVIAIPVTSIGLYLSTIYPPVLTDGGGIVLGSSLLFQLLSSLLPFAPEGLHPMAIAGWVGLFVTAINLLPAGQLDGGHIANALLGSNARYLGYASIFAMLLMSFFYPGWLFFAFLVILLGLRHPPPLNTISKLDNKRKIVGVLAIFIFLSSFVIVPLRDADVNFEVLAEVEEKTVWENNSVSFEIEIKNLGEIYSRYRMDITDVKLKTNNSTLTDKNYAQNLTVEYSYTFQNQTTSILNYTALTPRLKPGESLKVLINFELSKNYSNFNFIKIKLTVNPVGLSNSKSIEFMLAMRG